MQSAYIVHGVGTQKSVFGICFDMWHISAMCSSHWSCILTWLSTPRRSSSSTRMQGAGEVVMRTSCSDESHPLKLCPHLAVGAEALEQRRQGVGRGREAPHSKHLSDFNICLRCFLDRIRTPHSALLESLESNPHLAIGTKAFQKERQDAGCGHGARAGGCAAEARLQACRRSRRAAGVDARRACRSLCRHCSPRCMMRPGVKCISEKTREAEWGCETWS